MPDRKLDYHPLTLWNVPYNPHFFPEDGYSLYSSMFVEDLRTHIMPIGVHSSSTKRTFQVDINNSSLEMDVKVLFHVSYEHDPFYQNISEIIFEFIRETASFLLTNGGKAFYEIVEGSIDENDKLKSVNVLKLITGKVVRFGNTYYQMIPPEIQKGKHKSISVPKSKVWELKLPKSLGGRKDIVALSNDLRELAKASFLDAEIVTNQMDLFGFEVNEFNSSIDAAVLRASHRWGWDMRMVGSNQRILEYYLYYRMLRFSYSMAILRNDLLSKMNALLSRLGYDATMSFSGLPTPEELLDAIKKMEQRELSFKDNTFAKTRRKK
jgi:hypothetical protein